MRPVLFWKSGWPERGGQKKKICLKKRPLLTKMGQFGQRGLSKQALSDFLCSSKGAPGFFFFYFGDGVEGC